MCCEPSGLDKEDTDGECPECGQPTKDGQAIECCAYSPIACEKCNWRPCDGSC